MMTQVSIFIMLAVSQLNVFIYT